VLETLATWGLDFEVIVRNMALLGSVPGKCTEC